MAISLVLAGAGAAEISLQTSGGLSPSSRAPSAPREEYIAFLADAVRISKYALLAAGYLPFAPPAFWEPVISAIDPSN
jgi:hypothetical protein